MKKELRKEIKQLTVSHIRPVVEERVLMETLDLLGDWMGETTGKITHEMTDKELDQVADAIHGAYVDELIKQLKAFPNRKVKK